MARTAIGKAALVANAFLADPAGTAVDQANGMYIAAGHEADKILIRFENTTATDESITIVAGDNPPALRAGLGDYDGAVLAQNAVGWYGPFEAARFLQSDGTINVDFSVGTTGTVTAFVIPRVV